MQMISTPRTASRNLIVNKGREGDTFAESREEYWNKKTKGRATNYNMKKPVLFQSFVKSSKLSEDTFT